MPRFLNKRHALKNIETIFCRLANAQRELFTETQHKTWKWTKTTSFFLVLGKTSLSVILKIFLTFERFEPGDSYKLDSYKKKSV